MHLKSNVRLEVVEGAELIFSDHIPDYLPAVESAWEGLFCHNYSPLIYAVDCENIGLTGKGKLACLREGWKPWDKRPPSHTDALKKLYYMAADGVPAQDRQMANEQARLRPPFIEFLRCRNVLIKGLIEAEAFGLAADLTLKLELFQHTGSFKPRGAFNRLLLAEIPEAGVITASGGNHGQALAHVARVLGIRAEIFVPAGSPPLKAERIRAQGADVTVTGEYYDDAMEACLQRSAKTGALLVAEPGGAAALAALVSGAYEPEDGERVGVIVCGGNTGELPAAPSR